MNAGGDIRIKVAGLLVLGLGLLWGSVAMAQATPEIARIVDYPGIGNLLARVAIANKLCEKHGIRCERRTVSAGPLGVQTLLAGDVEVGSAPPEIVIQAAMKGAELKIFGNSVAAPPFFLVAGSHLDTPNAAKGYPSVIRDLKGKRIGVTARGAGTEFYLIAMLKDAGMSASDVVIVATGAANTTYPSLVNKQIDAAISFTPMDGFCEVLKACRMLVNTRVGEGPAGIVAMNGAAVPFFVRTEYAQKNPQVVSALSSAFREAEAFIQDPANFAAVRMITEETFKMDGPQGAAVVVAALKGALPSFKFELDPKALQAAANYLYESGQVSKKFDTSALLLSH